MVLKEVTDCAVFCTMWVVLEGFPKSMCMVLEQCCSYSFGVVLGTVLEWYCPSYCFGMVLGVVLEWNCPLYCFSMVLGAVLGWYCPSYCFNRRSCRIWKTFEDASLDVLILKLGTLSPFTTFSSGSLGSITPILKVAPWLSRLWQSLALVTIKVFRYFSPLNCK